jgi:1-deoxy-D-xylulose-5-phosphate synthase
MFWLDRFWTWLEKRKIGITPAMPSGSSLKFMMDAFPKRAFDTATPTQPPLTKRAIDSNLVYSGFTKSSRNFLFGQSWISGRRRSHAPRCFRFSLFALHSNMIIYAPINEIALQNILYTAQLGLDHPIAIRYPRGRGVIQDWQRNILANMKNIGKVFA